MPTLQTFLVFALADLALKMTPGPDMALTITRGMTQGFKIAWLSVLGTGAAGLVQIPVVVLGLAAVLQKSPLLFAGVKALGAAYLIYLGVRALLRSRHAVGLRTSAAQATRPRAVFWQGFWTNLLNPKVLLFMIAFLPQFADPGRGSVAFQLLFLAVYSKSAGLITGSVICYTASRIRLWFERNAWFAKVQEGVLGCVMIGVGVSIIGSRETASRLLAAIAGR